MAYVTEGGKRIAPKRRPKPSPPPPQPLYKTAPKTGGDFPAPRPTTDIGTSGADYGLRQAANYQAVARQRQRSAARADYKSEEDLFRGRPKARQQLEDRRTRAL